MPAGETPPMRSTQRHPVVEAMETRRLMSVTPTGDAYAAETDSQSALLLPAVQAAREARSAKVTLSDFVIVKMIDVASAKLP